MTDSPPSARNRPPLRRRIGGIALALLALVVVARIALRQADIKLRADLMDQARIVALAIPSEWAQSLQGSNADLQSAPYRHLKAQITAVRRANSRIRFVSLMGQNRQGQAVVLVDSEPETSADYSPPGDVYPEASATMLTAFDANAEALTAPEKDRWGTWISSFVPLPAAEWNGRPILAALDIDAANWQWLVLRQAALPVALAAIVILLALGLAMMQQSRRALRSHEAELSESEKRFIEIAGQSRTIVWEVDAEGLYTYVSPVITSVLGYRPDDLIGRRHFFDLMADAHREPLQASIRQAFANRQSITNLEIPLQTADGRIIWFSTHAIPLTDSSGTLIGYRGSDIDITERTRARKALQTSEAQKKTILDNIPMRVILLDKDLRILWANQTASESVGRRPEELAGQHCYDFWGDPGQPCESCPAQTAIRTGQHAHEIVRSPDGQIWDERAEPIVDEDGHLQAVVEVAENITSRRGSEEQVQTLLEESNQARKALLSILEDVRKTGQELQHQAQAQRILIQISSTFINRPLDTVEEAIQDALQSLATFSHADRAYIFAYDFERQICRNTHEWCAPGIEPAIDRLQAVPLSQMPAWIAAHREGRPMYIPDVQAMPPSRAREILQAQGVQSLIAVPILEAGRGIGFIGFDSVRQTYVYSENELNLLKIFAELLVNVQTRKRSEEDQLQLESQLMQSQKMDSIGRLAGGIAHDFNNMLTVILGRAEMALDQTAGFPHVQANLEEIRKVAENSISLTQQLLGFARKQTNAPRALDLNRTVGHMVQLLKRLIGENIELDWRLAADLWPVRADPSQIEQVLTNLCVNARDAIGGIGHITIETCNMMFNDGPPPGHAEIQCREFVRLSVRDDGCGMDPDTIGHLFEPFFTTKAPGKGTGLGLAMVYGIVKQHSGFIEIDSTPSKGSTFHIFWPRHAGPAEPVAEAPSPGSGGAAEPGHETILLVEDNPNILDLACELLQNLGYTVLDALTPEEALRHARNHVGPIDLLLTDVVMPEMNGRDLAEQIRPLHPNITPIFTSGYTADVIATNGILDDGLHFIQKPFTRDSLAAAIREALKG